MNKPGPERRVNGQDYTGQPSFSITVHGNATTKVVLTADDGLPVQSGYLFMWGTGGSSAYDVSIAYFYEYVQAGKLTVSNGSIESAEHTTFYFPVEYSPVKAGSGVNTGIAWAPEITTTPKQFNITATLYLTDESGTGRVYGSKTLPYTGHAAQFVSEVFPELNGAEFRGYVEVQAEYNLFLEVLRIDFIDNGFLLTSTPPDFTTP